MLVIQHIIQWSVSSPHSDQQCSPSPILRWRHRPSQPQNFDILLGKRPHFFSKRTFVESLVNTCQNGCNLQTKH